MKERQRVRYFERERNPAKISALSADMNKLGEMTALKYGKIFRLKYENAS